MAEEMLGATPAGQAPRDQEIWQLGVVSLAAGFAARSFSPLDALRAFRRRLAEVNPRLNAVIATDWSTAEIDAAASDDRWQKGEGLGLLDGVPVVIKDSLAVKGLPATWGSRLFEHSTPSRDELPVARLRQAGAIILGKTNVPEFTITGVNGGAISGQGGGVKLGHGRKTL